MMDILPLGFLMGLMGSLHCAVMCGPMMLGMPFVRKNILQIGIDLFLYQSGRIFTYSLLGILAGLLGSSIKLFSDQRMLSMIIGCAMVIITCLQWSKHYKKSAAAISAKAIQPLTLLMGKILAFRMWSLFAGILNGIIPCGMVYLALATAVNTGSSWKGATFMFLFGLGTTPLMMMISFGGIYLKQYIRFNTQKLLPWMMLGFGTLFILRSAELGIPIISPRNSSGYGQVTHCR